MANHARRKSAGKDGHGKHSGEHATREIVRNDVRVSIADRAARLIAEGMTDYHAAKLKAARQLGVTDSVSLPDNREIEAALRGRIALFQGESQPAALEALRDTALRAMRWLERFSPWLSGAVLSGTANEFSAIELELVATEPKTFELFLHNEGVEFDTRQTGTRERGSFIVEYEIEFDGVPLLVALFDNHAQRQAAYPRESIRHERVQLADARNFFAHEVNR